MALDDEELPSPYLPATVASPYDTVAPEQPQSALGEDYGGGQDQPQPQVPLAAARMLVERATRNPAPAGSNRAMLQDLVRQRLADREREAAAAPSRVTYGGFDANALSSQVDFNGPELQLEAPPPPKEEAAGWGTVAARGIMRGTEDIKQGAEVAGGKRPKASKTAPADYEQPPELADFANPVLLAKKAVFGFSRSYPAMALGMAGALAGGAVGSAVPVVGPAIGGVAGGAIGMGAGAALQEIGPAYQAELDQLGENPTQKDIDGAWDRAMVNVEKAGLVGAASMAMFGAGKPLANFAKNFFAKPVLDAAGKQVVQTAGIPLRAGVQLAGQEAVSVGGEVAYNAATGKPLDTNLSQAAAGGVLNVLPDVAVAMGGRGLRRVLGGRPGEATPGVMDDQNAALRAAQGEEYGPNQPLGPPMPPEMRPGPGGTPLPGTPVPPGRRFGTPEPPPPPPPPPGGPGGADLGGGPAGPGGVEPGGAPPRPPGGPGGAPLGPEPTPAPPGVGIEQQGPPRPPGMGGPGGTPLGPEPMPPPPPRPMGGPGGTPLPEEMPPPVRPVPPTEPPGPPPGMGPGGMPPLDQPMPPPRPTGPTPAGPGGTPLRPEPTPGVPPAPEPPPRGPTPPGPGGTPLPEERGIARLSIEPDHLDPARSVAKNPRGDVIGKGATPEEALADARPRGGEPYPEEGAAPAEQAKPTETGTSPIGAATADLRSVIDREFPNMTPEQREAVLANLPPEQREAVLATLREAEAERAPPAGAAKAEPAAAPEKPPTKAQQRKAAAEAKLAEVKAKAAEKLQTETDSTRTESVTKTVEERTQKAPRTADNMTAPELRAALREAGHGPAVMRMKVAGLRDLYKGELAKAGKRTKGGAYATPGEAAEPAARRTAPPKETSEMARQARAEGQQATREALVSEATRKMAEMPPDTRDPYHVPENINTERKAERVVRNILAGQKIADAVAAFGSKIAGTVGRPRNVESLSTFIRDALKKTETPESVERARQRVMGEFVPRFKKLPAEPVASGASPQRRALSAELKAALDHLDEVAEERPRLEEALDAIEKHEAGIKGPASIRPRPAAAGPDAATYFTRRPEVNEPVTRQVEQAGEHGARLHDLLDALGSHTPANRLTPHLAELARVLRRVLPNVEVHDAAGRLDPSQVGIYDPRTGRIYLDLDHPATAVTMLHEGVHTGTFDYVNHLYQTPEINLTPRELAHKSALEAIRSELQRLEGDTSRMSPAEHGELRYALNEDVDPALNMAGPHELTTQILTSSELYNVLSRERASPELRAALDRVGMGVSSRASIWDSFKRIIRNIFGVPDRLDSVFDHVLRPLTEIVETGSQFRRPQDIAAIRETTRHNNEVLGPARLRDAAGLREYEGIVRRFGSNLADRAGRLALRGSFHTLTLDALHDAIKPYVPSVTAYQRAHEAIGETAIRERTRNYTTYTEDGRAIDEPHADKTARLHDQLKFGPDGQEAQTLMTDITMAKADLFDPQADNSHVPQNVLGDLQQRYGQLDPAARQAIREVAQVYTERDRAERTARIRQFVEAAAPEFTRAQQDDVVRHMSTLGGIEDILENTDRSALAQSLGPRWANSKDLLNHLAESERKGFVTGTYYPANRFGEYVVSAGKAGTPEYVVQMFERPNQAKEFKARLEQERNDVSQVFTKTDANFRQQIVPDQALALFDRTMEKAGIPEDRARVLREIYASHMIQQGMRQAQRTMKREYIAGASNEQARNLMQDFAAHTARMGHLTHQGELIRAYFQADKEARALHQAGPNQGTAPQVAAAQTGVAELRRRMTPPDGDNSADQMGRGVRAITSLTVADALIRPAHLVMNMLGNHLFATGMLGGRHGAVASTAELARAYAQLTGTAGGAVKRNMMAVIRRELKAANWMTSELYRERLRNAGDIKPEHADLLIDDFNRSNIINQTHMSEVRRMAGPDGWTGANGPFGFVARGLDIVGAGEHVMDSAMRVAIGKAAFVMELRKNGGDVMGALAYAKQVARKSMPDWNFYNRPRLTTKQGFFGQFGSIITQFKSFGFHAYGVQGNLIADMVRKGGAERTEALKTLAMLHSSHALLAGGIGATVFGGVPMMAVMGMYDYLSGSDRPHTNRDWEVWMRNYVKNTTGSKTAADIYQYGLPAGVGLNLSPSLRFSNITGVPELRTFDAAGYAEFAAKVFTGAAGGTVERLAETATQILRGDTSMETLSKMLPLRILEDPAKAYIYATRGMRDTKGTRTVVPAGQFSPSDIVAKGFGFLPSVATDAQMARATIDRTEKVREDMQEPLMRNLLQAVVNKRDTKEAIAAITRFNAAVPDTDKITGQQIQARLKGQAVAEAMVADQFGMTVPRRQYGKVHEVTAFARP